MRLLMFSIYYYLAISSLCIHLHKSTRRNRHRDLGAVAWQFDTDLLAKLGANEFLHAPANPGHLEQGFKF